MFTAIHRPVHSDHVPTQVWHARKKRRSSYWQTIRVYLFTDAGTVPAPGFWSTYTATYVGLAGDVGLQIQIELSNTHAGGQANFDNVWLSDDAVAPEPSTLVLFGIVFGGLPFLWRHQVRCR